VPAGQAQAQVHPAVAALQALLAARGARDDRLDLVGVRARRRVDGDVDERVGVDDRVLGRHDRGSLGGGLAVRAVEAAHRVRLRHRVGELGAERLEHLGGEHRARLDLLGDDERRAVALELLDVVGVARADDDRHVGVVAAHDADDLPGALGGVVGDDDRTGALDARLGQRAQPRRVAEQDGEVLVVGVDGAVRAERRDDLRDAGLLEHPRDATPPAPVAGDDDVVGDALGDARTRLGRGPAREDRARSWPASSAARARADARSARAWRP
jgi:hypothetical protein